MLIYSAGKGSAFLPYATGLASYLNAKGASAVAVESTGSIDNLKRVDASPAALGTAFLGTAHEAVNASAAWTQGKKLTNVRALFPMYETSFQVVALASSGLAAMTDLRGRRVGVGPAGGPAESFFIGLTQEIGVPTQRVTGSPDELTQDLLEGRIDALWQGAVLPIAAIKKVADAAVAVVFGLSKAEQSAMRARFPFLSASVVEAQTYRGLTQSINSVSAWNFVVGHKDLSSDDAYWITKTVLSAANPLAIAASAGSTRSKNAVFNTILPFHDGALRYYKEVGVTVV
jgi:TRAP transporter TAXI family solute receptor